MSAKILYSLSSDDNPKQLGCINGFLQHFLSGRVVNGHGDHHHQKRLLLQGQAKVESKDGKEVTNKGKKSPKNNNKEISSKMSTESSSMASSSSSSTSSTLSPSQDFVSINSHQLSLKSSRKKHIISNVMVHIDSPRPLQPSNYQNQNLSTTTNTPPRTHKHSSSVDLKEKKKPHARRLSYDGRESERSNLKLAELPRLSLDSRQGRMRSASASVSATASEFRSEFLQEEPVSNRAVSSIVAKLMGLDDLPSSTPKSNRSRKSEDLDLVSRSTRSTDESDTESDRHSVSIYKEIDKRLGDLDFKKSSKDLRALKHILEAMQRTKPKTEIRPEENIQEACTKRSQYQEHKGIKNQETLPRVRTRQATNAKPSVVEKKRAKDLSPKIKTPQKFDKLEKFSQERRARSVVNVITSSQETKKTTKQNTKSSRKNMESRTKKVVDQCDMVHTPPPSQKPHKSMNEEFTVIVKEQPSPVSVLDADFYDDESLSPINKKATTFRDDDDDDSPVLAKAEWISEMDTNHFSNNTRSSSSNKEKTNDFRYKDDENDFLTSIIAKDLAKSWTDFSSENSWLVLDIERLIFKDLIVELLHG